MRKIKCVVVGDEIAEKTKLLMKYVTDDVNEYIPIVSDHFNKEIIVNDQEVDMQLWDTSCQQDYSKIRPLSYPQTDVFILAFALINPFSLDSIESFWLPEIREHCPDAPYILVGTFKNARDDFDNHKEEYKSNGWEPVPTSKGEEVKATILANDYIECDFESKRSIEKVFLRAAKIGLNGGRPDDDEKKKKEFLKICLYSENNDSKTKLPWNTCSATFTKGKYQAMKIRSISVSILEVSTFM